MNKRKIINDPVYGFINISFELLFDIIEHPFFQRLRRIKQLGLTNSVYPGANHTRFQHALGTVYLIQSAVNIIRLKDHEITPEEEEAVTLALLLHDIGHGPFSHTTEYNLVGNLNHEELSILFIEELNRQFDNRLADTLLIVKNQHPKKFLHELVSSQLDMDRLDYLKRDSFFTGVSEGIIGSDRIIKMLNVVNDKLVIDEKGIYSIEKFLLARRLMYWQVYLHKTVIATEQLLLKIMKRARSLISNGEELFGTPFLLFFLNNDFSQKTIYQLSVEEQEKILHNFAQLDDSDILSAIKVWSTYHDPLLSSLCKRFLNRQLYKIEIHNQPIPQERIAQLKEHYITTKYMPASFIDYFVFSGEISNNAYNVNDEKIKILHKNGELVDITTASDILKTDNLSQTTTKYFLCCPKDL